VQRQQRLDRLAGAHVVPQQPADRFVLEINRTAVEQAAIGQPTDAVDLVVADAGDCTGSSYGGTHRGRVLVRQPRRVNVKTEGFGDA
jgi:hypothetical protein